MWDRIEEAQTKPEEGIQVEGEREKWARFYMGHGREGRQKGWGSVENSMFILLGFKLPKRNTTVIPPVCVRDLSLVMEQAHDSKVSMGMGSGVQMISKRKILQALED